MTEHKEQPYIQVILSFHQRNTEGETNFNTIFHSIRYKICKHNYIYKDFVLR